MTRRCCILSYTLCPKGKRVWKSTVIITTPELCIRKDVMALLQRKIAWDVLVVDEAHRLKNSASRLNVGQEWFAIMP